MGSRLTVGKNHPVCLLRHHLPAGRAAVSGERFGREEDVKCRLRPGSSNVFKIMLLIRLPLESVGSGAELALSNKRRVVLSRLERKAFELDGHAVGHPFVGVLEPYRIDVNRDALGLGKNTGGLV